MGISGPMGTFPFPSKALGGLVSFSTHIQSSNSVRMATTKGKMNSELTNPPGPSPIPPFHLDPPIDPPPGSHSPTSTLGSSKDYANDFSKDRLT